MRVMERMGLGELRKVEIDGEEWFVGRDAALALGFSNPNDALATHVLPEDKLLKDGLAKRYPVPERLDGKNEKAERDRVADCYPIKDRLGRVQCPVLISESGVYDLALGSRLPAARRLARWLTHEVLPAIEKDERFFRAVAASAKAKAELAKAESEKAAAESGRDLSVREYDLLRPYLEGRKLVCVIEIWERCFKRGIPEFEPDDGKRIVRAMRRLGWRFTGRQPTRGYGKQITFAKGEDSND